jgi:TonB family protein
MKTFFFILIGLLLPLIGVGQQDVRPPASPVKITMDDAALLLLRAVDPVPPSDVRNLIGRVELELRIDKLGNVAGVTVMVGNPALAGAAVEAFKQYKFRPYMVKESPTEVVCPAVSIFSGTAEGAQSYPGNLDAARTGTAQLSRRLRISAVLLDQNKIHDEKPRYPGAAQMGHIQGDVVIRVTINKLGRVENLNAVSGHPLLREEALEAVKEWRYKPFLVNGDPVEVDSLVTVQFRM